MLLQLGEPASLHYFKILAFFVVVGGSDFVTVDVYKPHADFDTGTNHT